MEPRQNGKESLRPDPCCRDRTSGLADIASAFTGPTASAKRSFARRFCISPQQKPDSCRPGRSGSISPWRRRNFAPVSPVAVGGQIFTALASYSLPSGGCSSLAPIFRSRSLAITKRQPLLPLYARIGSVSSPTGRASIFDQIYLHSHIFRIKLRRWMGRGPSS